MRLTRLRPLRLLAILAVISMFAVTAFANVSDTVRKSFTVRPGGTLTIDADFGSIDVRGSSTADQVTIQVKRSVRTNDRERAKDVLDELEMDFRQSGDDVVVTARYDRHDRGWGFLDFFDWSNDSGRGRLRLEYHVTVPSRYNLELRTSGGNIAVDDLEGRADVRTSGGNLMIGRIDGPVTGHTSGGNIVVARSIGKTEVRTSGGNITIEESEGPVDARTSGGDIRIDSARGTVYARSSGGDIEANGALGSIDASTSGGSVVARMSEQPTGNCRLATSGGSIAVHIAHEIGFDIDARASGGSIDSGVPVTIQGTYSKHRLEGRVNDGGPTLTVRTSGGGIRLKEY